MEGDNRVQEEHSERRGRRESEQEEVGRVYSGNDGTPTSGSSGTSTREGGENDTNNDINRGTSHASGGRGGVRSEMNIFDRFMNTISGGGPNRAQRALFTIPLVSSGNRGRGDGHSGPATAGATSGATVGATGGPNDGTIPSGTNSTVGGAQLSSTSTASADANGGAIVITVNYVFSDENNPQNPNRSGSLVMTLPNNPSNRDPRIIQEFIRLATHMAYTTIFNGLSKERGITSNKFDSFPSKIPEDLHEGAKSCPICYEDYVRITDDKKRTLEGQDEGPSEKCKRRKLNNEQALGSANEEEYRPNGAPEALTSLGNKLLSECNAEFAHIPVEMPCGHIFGKSCLFEWLKDHSTCPLCRNSVGDAANENSTREANTTTTSENEPNNTPNVTYLFNNNFNNIRLINRPTQPSYLLESLSRSRDTRQTASSLYGSRPGGSQEQSSSTEQQAPNTSNSTDNSQSSEVPRDGHGSSARTSNGVFSHLLTYLRRSQPSGSSGPLFPTGVASVRTPTGVETRQSDSSNSNEILDFMNLRNLVYPDNEGGPDSEQQRTSTSQLLNQTLSQNGESDTTTRLDESNANDNSHNGL